LIEQETKTVAEKVRKLRQTLNSLNDEIKNFEKEHQAQVDHLSSQKRWVNVKIQDIFLKLIANRRRERRRRN
jgi:predicted  nucleic acid-binding Zn-ribbon protein